MTDIELPPWRKQRDADPAPIATNFYETRCGGCGEGFVFKNTLTDWTQVWCHRCGFIKVR